MEVPGTEGTFSGFEPRTPVEFTDHQLAIRGAPRPRLFLAP